MFMNWLHCKHKHQAAQCMLFHSLYTGAIKRALSALKYSVPSEQIWSRVNIVEREAVVRRRTGRAVYYIHSFREQNGGAFANTNREISGEIHH